MGESLAAVGIEGAYEGAEALADNPDMVTRTHFARWLVSTGVCRDTQEVFRRFLTTGKPGYVAQQWASLRDAVSWIRGAGGLAVIAHPARYHYSATEEWALFEEFKAHGGRGVEVLTASHTPADAAKYAGTAREYGLLASRGSDFHAPGESRVELGALPALPAGLTPVWSELQQRILHA
jgi:predicted metal-dependent phosphoesterase TrpH